jgi:hypothetical protein
LIVHEKKYVDFSISPRLNAPLFGIAGKFSFG